MSNFGKFPGNPYRIDDDPEEDDDVWGIDIPQVSRTELQERARNSKRRKTTHPSNDAPAGPFEDDPVLAHDDPVLAQDDPVLAQDDPVLARDHSSVPVVQHDEHAAAILERTALSRPGHHGAEDTDAPTVLPIQEPSIDSHQPESLDQIRNCIPEVHRQDSVCKWQRDLPARLSQLIAVDSVPSPPSSVISREDECLVTNVAENHPEYPDSLSSTSLEHANEPELLENNDPELLDQDEGFDDEESETIEASFHMSTFELAMAIFVKDNSISRSSYQQLLEVLGTAESLGQLSVLPTQKDTLLSRLNSQLPVLKTHKKMMQLDSRKTPSRAAAEAEMVVCDVPDILQTLLSAEKLRKEVYTGMARLVTDEATDPWEARWWGESVRTGNGKFNVDRNQEPILPSDFVTWVCGDDTCRCEQDNKPHLGRVVWSGEDWRDDRRGVPLVMLEQTEKRRALDPDKFECTWTMRNFTVPRGSEELVLVHDTRLEVAPSQITGRIQNVFIDYQFDEDCDPSVISSPYFIRYVYHEERQLWFSVNKKSPLRAELELARHSRQHILKNFMGDHVLSLPLNFYCDEFGLFRTMRRSELGVYLFPLFFPSYLRARQDAAITLTLGPFASKMEDVFDGLSHIAEIDGGIRMVLDGKAYFVCPFIAYITGDMPSQDKMSCTKAHSALRPCRYCMIHVEERDNLYYDTLLNGRTHHILMGQIQEMESKTRKVDKAQAGKDFGISENTELRDSILKLFPCLDLVRARPIDVAHSEYQGIAGDIFDLMFTPGSFLSEGNITSLCAQFKMLKMPPGWPQLQSPSGGAKTWRMQEYQRGAIILPIILLNWLRDSHLGDNLCSAIKSTAPKYLDVRRFNNFDSISASDWIILACWQFALSIMALGGRRNSKDDLATLHQTIIDGRKGVQFLATALAEEQAIKKTRAEEDQKKKDAAQNTKASRGKAKATMPPPQRPNTRSRRDVPLLRVATSNSPAPGSSSDPTSPSFTVSPTSPNTATISDMRPSSSGIISQAPAPANSVIASSVVAITNVSLKSRRAPRADHGERAVNYLRKTALPNLHQGIHLAQDREEFGAAYMTTTWFGEWHHRVFKLLSASCNMFNMSATLIRRDQEARLLCYLTAGCFDSRKGYQELAKVMRTLREKCPKMTDHMDLFGGLLNEAAEVDQGTLDVQPDEKHLNPKATSKVSLGNVRSKLDPLLRVEQPGKEETTSKFMTLLRQAYRRDYGRAWVTFRGEKLQWANKMSWQSPKFKRRTFFEVVGFARLFVVLTLVEEKLDSHNKPVVEPLLSNSPLMKLGKERIIAGLPALDREVPWVTGHRGSETDFICIQSDLQFM